MPGSEPCPPPRQAATVRASAPGGAHGQQARTARWAIEQCQGRRVARRQRTRKANPGGRRSPHRTPAEDSELAVLNAQSQQSWEHFIWGYRAAGQTVGFTEAIEQLFHSPAAGQPPRNEDYTFWIHVMVMWLFEKKRLVATWEEAIRAYNGSGQRAAHYRDAVVARRDGAAAAAQQHTDFVPGRI